MTRFAGGIDLSPPTLASAGGGSNYSAAAGVVDVNDALAAQRSKSPKYGDLSAYAMKTEADKFGAAMDASAKVTGAGITSLGNAKSGQMAAQAEIKAAETAAEAQKSSAMMGALGGIASAGLKLIPGLG